MKFVCPFFQHFHDHLMRVTFYWVLHIMSLLWSSDSIWSKNFLNYEILGKII